MLTELATGVSGGIFVDDTGSPGLSATPDHLHPMRKSWVAVVVPSQLAPIVMEQMPLALDEIRSETGASEIHAADVFGKRGEFADVPVPTRISIFEFMSWIFDRYNFPILVQTLDPDSTLSRYVAAELPLSVGPLDLTNHEHLALLTVLIRARNYLRDELPDNVARVFVDEGIVRAGSGIRIPDFEPQMVDGMVCFADSASVFPLQLADFAAYALNRTQLLRKQSELSESDMLFLKIIEPVTRNFRNIEVRSVDVENWRDES
jgi:hypothetical protein